MSILYRSGLESPTRSCPAKLKYREACRLTAASTYITPDVFTWGPAPSGSRRGKPAKSDVSPADLSRTGSAAAPPTCCPGVRAATACPAAWRQRSAAAPDAQFSGCFCKVRRVPCRPQPYRLSGCFVYLLPRRPRGDSLPRSMAPAVSRCTRRAIQRLFLQSQARPLQTSAVQAQRLLRLPAAQASARRQPALQCGASGQPLHPTCKTERPPVQLPIHSLAQLGMRQQ